MRVHLVNPSDVSFGIGVITPRWLFVLAAATPARYGDPIIIDETLERFVPEAVQPGDVVHRAGVSVYPVERSRKCSNARRNDSSALRRLDSKKKRTRARAT